MRLPSLVRTTGMFVLAACLSLAVLPPTGAAAAEARPSVQGRVVDSAGNPLPGLPVVAFARRGDGLWTNSAGRTTTAADGTFTVAGPTSWKTTTPVRLLVLSSFGGSSDGEPSMVLPLHAPQWIGGGVDWAAPTLRWGAFPESRTGGATYQLGTGGASVSGVEVTMTQPAGVVRVDARSEAGDDQAVEVRYRPEAAASEQSTSTISSSPFVLPHVFAPGTHELAYRVAGTTSAWRTTTTTVTADTAVTADLVTPNEIGATQKPLAVMRTSVAGSWPFWTAGLPMASVPGAVTTRQWYRGNTPIAGATGARLVTPPRDGHGRIQLRFTLSKPGYAPTSWFTESAPAEFPVIKLRASKKRVMAFRGNTVTVNGRVRMSDGSKLRRYTSNRKVRWSQTCSARQFTRATSRCVFGTVTMGRDDTFRFRLPRQLLVRRGIHAELNASRGNVTGPTAPLTVTPYQPRVRITANRRTVRVGQWVRVRPQVSTPSGVPRRTWPTVELKLDGRALRRAYGKDGQVLRVRMTKPGTHRIVGFVYGGCGYRCTDSTQFYKDARSNTLTIRVRR